MFGKGIESSCEDVVDCSGFFVVGKKKGKLEEIGKDNGRRDRGGVYGENVIDFGSGECG